MTSNKNKQQNYCNNGTTVYNALHQHFLLSLIKKMIYKERNELLQPYKKKMVTTFAISTSHDFCIWQRKHEGEKLVNCLSHHIVNRQFASLFDYKVSLSSAHSGCISITRELWVRGPTILLTQQQSNCGDPVSKIEENHS